MPTPSDLRWYASLLIRKGLNVQPEQVVRISCEPIHRDLAMLAAEIAYDAGALSVGIEFDEPRLPRLQLERASLKGLEYVPEYWVAKYRELVDGNIASLRIGGSEYPEILGGLDPVRVSRRRKALYEAQRYFIEEGISHSRVQWCIAGAPTPAWARKVFETTEREATEENLWNAIFQACRKPESLIASPSEDTHEIWDIHDEKLQKRASLLNEREIQTLHFTGPGTDLYLELTLHARFKGGSEMTTSGVQFNPNLPTEEVFTTPDCRKTRGTVRVTRPFFISGTLIRELCLTFKDGKIVAFSAASGEEVFAEYSKTDEGAAFIGEVALVGTDSPIFQSGLVFKDILFDENAACHIAMGSSYQFCLDGTEDYTREELDGIGCNFSAVHVDMMTSNESIDVEATTFGGEKILLIRQGCWVTPFNDVTI